METGFEVTDSETAGQTDVLMLRLQAKPPQSKTIHHRDARLVPEMRELLCNKIISPLLRSFAAIACFLRFIDSVSRARLDLCLESFPEPQAFHSAGKGVKLGIGLFPHGTGQGLGLVEFARLDQGVDGR